MRKGRRRAGDRFTACAALGLAVGCLGGSGLAFEMPRYGSWRSSRIGGGGYLQAIVFCPSDPNRVYVIVDTSGPYRSDDGGGTWRMLEGGLPPRQGNYSCRGLSVDPRDADRLIIANGSKWAPTEGIYVSDDGGGSWAQTLKTDFVSSRTRVMGDILARSPDAPDVVLAASVGSGVWRSADNGTTWTCVGLKGINPVDLDFDRSDGDRAWLCAVAGAERPGNRDGVFQGGFHRSLDGGLTWTRLLETSPTEITQDPADAETLYGIFGRADLRVSRDAGRTWEDFAQGLAKTDGADPRPREVGYLALAAGPDFLLTATDRGGAFFRRGPGDAQWRGMEREGIECGDWWGGRSRFARALAYIAVDPFDPDHWLFTDWYALWQTFDRGRNWVLTVDGIESTVIHNFAQDPADPGVVHMGMADNGYFISSDGGKTFSQNLTGITNNIKDIDLYWREPARLYAVGTDRYRHYSNQVFVSVDRGATWQRSPMTGLPDMRAKRCITVAASQATPLTVYLAVSGDVAAGGGGPYLSTDGGKTWRWIGEGLPAGPLFSGSIWATGREMAAGPDGSLVALNRSKGRIHRYAPETKAWRRVGGEIRGTPHCVTASRFAPGTYLVAIRHAGIHVTEDGGATWRRTYEGDVSHVASDRAVAGRFAASTSDGVILCNDGGATWRALDRSLPERWLYNMPVFAGDRLLVGSNGSGAFWTALSPEARRDVAARPATMASVAPVDTRVPEFVMPRRAEDTGALAAWTVSTRRGKIELSCDAGEVFGGPAWAAEAATARRRPASLRIRSVGGPATGRISQRADAQARVFRISGAIKADVKEARKLLLCVRGYDAGGRKSVSYEGLRDVTRGVDWTRFSDQVTQAEGAEESELVLEFDGEGTVWLDGLKVSPVGKVFPDSPGAKMPKGARGTDEPGATPAPSILPNSDMSAGEEIPEGWRLSWTGAGKLRAFRDTASFRSAPASLCLETVDGEAYGTVSLGLPAGLRAFGIRGYGKARGEGLEQALVAVQCFDGKGKQVAFVSLADLRRAGDWRAFSRSVALPERTRHATLAMIIKGTGRVWLDDLHVADE